MFWKSILLGLKIFANPWVLSATLALVVLNMAYLQTIRLATKTKESQEAAGTGCLTQVLGLFFQGLITACFVLLLLPVILGIQDQLSWASVEPMGIVAARAGILATFLVSLVTFIPLIGRFLASSPGLESFLIATLTFRFLSPVYLEAILWPKASVKGLFPNLWESLGFFLLAILLTRLLMLLVIGLAAVLNKKSNSLNSRTQWLQIVGGPSFDILAGILPFLMYVQFVGLAISPLLTK